MDKLSITAEYTKDFQAPAIERKHIILLDGTWNDETGLKGDGLVTNIVRLSRILKDDNTIQIVRYHRGVGNDNDNSWISQTWNGATGRAVGKIVEQAYARFVQDWQNGDRIYIFGFSRGAAAARLLASKIHEEGLPGQIKITLAPKQNKETKVIEQVISDIEIVDPKKHFVEIEFVGVWDTVSAFGVPNILERYLRKQKSTDVFSDNHIAANIQRAVHLVAIDETRNAFVPSLMNYKEGVTHEVWFPGVHSDIGGSYAEDSLARASLHYMFKQLFAWNDARKLNPFLVNEDSYQSYTATKIDKVYFHFHGDSAIKDIRTIGVQVNGKIDPNLKPKIHELYNQIALDKNAFSVLDADDDDKKDIRYTQFLYKPYNVKILSDQFEVVS